MIIIERGLFLPAGTMLDLGIYKRPKPRYFQKGKTPKAFANFSPGLEAKRQPWGINIKAFNPERVPSASIPAEFLTLSGLDYYFGN
jgi:hypothetical protein